MGGVVRDTDGVQVLLVESKSMTCLSKDPISRELSAFYFYRRKMPKRLRPVRRDIERKSVGGYKIQQGGPKKRVKVFATQFAAASASPFT